MATQWSTMLAEIQGIVKDADFQTSGTYVNYLLTYANDAQMKICELLDIRRMLKTSTVAVTTSNYRYDMPTDFLRLSGGTRVYVGTTDYFIEQVTKEYFNYLDPDHSETTTATSGPTYVCLDGSEILIYPKWTGTLNIVDYFRTPTLMTITTSTPDILLEGIATDRIVKDMIIDYVCSVVYAKWLHEPEYAALHYNSFLNGINQAKMINPTDAKSDFVEPAFG